MSQYPMRMSSQGHYRNGQWVLGQGAAFASENPANGEPLWHGRTATADEIQEACEAARAALPHWSTLDVAQRASYLHRFAKHIERRREELAHWISLETGKPHWEALTEVQSVMGKISLSLEAYHERTGEKEILQADATGRLRYKPHGVVAVLGPFNFPAHLSNGHIVPALLAGNTVVYKPSELAPGVAECVMRCWHDSGLPAGVINCLQGDAQCAQMLLKHDIQGVYFTGSYRTGLLIHQQFSTKPEVLLALELGGNNPLLVDTVQNIPAAVYHTLLSTLLTAGQRCTSARRLLIADNAHGDTFLTAFLSACTKVRVGPFTDRPEPFMGPVIRHSHALKLIHAADQLKRLGGQTLLQLSLLQNNTGFLSPGVIDMSNVATPPDEEIFAPLVQVYRYRDFEHALLLANQTRYGLAAGLLSDDPTHYRQFYNTIRAGLINWNRPTTGALSSLPFGGIGQSGNHRPSAYFAADYCAYPIASLEQPIVSLPKEQLPGITWDDEHARL